MPTFFTHALVGGALVQAAPKEASVTKAAMALIFVSSAADLDVIAFRFGIPYAHTFGHRGFFHSLCFAFLFSFLIALLFQAGLKRFSLSWWGFWGLAFLAAASHGLLDMATDGGLGIGYFLPFDSHRYFFDFRPIVVAYINPRHFFSSPKSIAVMVSEFKWVGLPLIFLSLAWQIGKRSTAKR